MRLFSFSSTTGLVARRSSLVARLSVAALVGGAIAVVPAAHGQTYLDITSLTTGTGGNFAGTLGGVSVTGAITTSDPNFSFFPTGTGFGDSTINNSSPQFSYSNIFTPAQALTDKVGYGAGVGFTTATITIGFSSAITNPVFHIANIDGAQFNFAPTTGLGGLVLLSGNGGGGDGIQVSGTVISDANPATIIGVAPTTPPPTTGARSGYGSVQLLGTFTTLAVNVTPNTSFGGDGGSFTLSTAPASGAPEPGTLPLLGMGLVSGMGTLGIARKRRKNAAR